MDISNKKTYIILFLILLLSFTINISTFNKGHNWNNVDFAGYLLCTKSLLEGTVNELVSFDRFLISHSTKETGTILGNWGFPFLLSPVYYAFGLNLYAMKVYVNLFFLLSLWMVFLLFRNRLTNFENLLLIAALAFNSWFFDFKENVLSDIPFLFFSLLSLYLIKQFIIQNKICVNKLFSYSLIGVLIFISNSIRSVGLILLPLLLSVQYFESRHPKSKNESLLLNKINYVPYLIFIVLFAVIMLSLPGAESISLYFKNLTRLNISRIMFDIKYYLVLPSRFFPFLNLNMNSYGFGYNKVSLILYGLMLILVVLGIKKTYKKDYMFLIYMLITMPIIMFFSGRQGFRLLIPIFPFFLYFLFAGLSAITLSFDLSGNSKSYKINTVSFFGVGLVVVSVLYLANTVYQNKFIDKVSSDDVCEAGNQNPYYNDGLELFHFIKANTDPADGIIFFKPRIMSLYADRKSFALSKWTFKFEQLLNSPARYIAYNKRDNIFNLTSQTLRDNFECIFENDTFILCNLKSKKPRDS